MEQKYFVVSFDDANRYLSADQRAQLAKLTQIVNQNRLCSGRPQANYMVFNPGGYEELNQPKKKAKQDQATQGCNHDCENCTLHKSV